MRHWQDILPREIAIEQESYEFRHRLKRAYDLGVGMSKADRSRYGLTYRQLAEKIGKTQERVRQHVQRAWREDRRGIRSPAEVYINQSAMGTALGMFPEGSVSDEKRLQFADTQITEAEVKRGVEHLRFLDWERKRIESLNRKWNAQRALDERRNRHCQSICVGFYTQAEIRMNPWLSHKAAERFVVRPMFKRPKTVAEQLAELRRITGKM